MTDAAPTCGSRIGVFSSQFRVPELVHRSINPNLADAVVEEMLIQHLLTERLFRTVFNNRDFARRNIIAAEIQKVIDALASQCFSHALGSCKPPHRIISSTH
jgi:predicted helicase